MCVILLFSESSNKRRAKSDSSQNIWITGELHFNKILWSLVKQYKEEKRQIPYRAEQKREINN